MCIEPQNISNNQINLKKNKAGSTSFPDLKIHYKVMAIKMVWYWHKKTLRSIELNRQLRKRKQKTLLHGQLIYDEEGRKSQWGKDSPSNKLSSGNWTVTCKRMKLDPYLILYTKISSKWIKDLNVKPETIKLMEERVLGKLHDTGLGNDFLVLTPKTKLPKQNKLVWLLQTKNLLHSIGNHQQNEKATYVMCKNICKSSF